MNARYRENLLKREFHPSCCAFSPAFHQLTSAVVLNACFRGINAAPQLCAILVGGISPCTRFGGIGGAAAANTGFPAAERAKQPSSRRQPT